MAKLPTLVRIPLMMILIRHIWCSELQRKELIEESVRKFLGVKSNSEGIPLQGKDISLPPRYMMDLYEKYRSGEKPMQGNTVRSILAMKDSIDGTEILIFNLTGIKPTEQILQSKLFLLKRQKFKPKRKRDFFNFRLQIGCLPNMSSFRSIDISLTRQKPEWQSYDISSSVVSCRVSRKDGDQLLGLILQVKRPKGVLRPVNFRRLIKATSQPFVLIFSEEYELQAKQSKKINSGDSFAEIGSLFRPSVSSSDESDKTDSMKHSLSRRKRSDSFAIRHEAQKRFVKKNILCDNRDKSSLDELFYSFLKNLTQITHSESKASKGTDDRLKKLQIVSVLNGAKTASEGRKKYHYLQSNDNGWLSSDFPTVGLTTDTFLKVLNEEEKDNVKKFLHPFLKAMAESQRTLKKKRRNSSPLSPLAKKLHSLSIKAETDSPQSMLKRKSNVLSSLSNKVNVTGFKAETGVSTNTTRSKRSVLSAIQYSAKSKESDSSAKSLQTLEEKPSRKSNSVSQSRHRNKERNGGRTDRKRKRRRNRKLPSWWTGHENRLHSQDYGRLCQRKSLMVDFSELGWDDWIISPKTFNAHYCAGTCSFPLIKEAKPSNHAAIQSLIHATGINPNVPSPCCVPSVTRSLTLLYFDENGGLVLKNYPNMIVEKCACR
ncbi:uncharacterized protein LOC129217026 [Uloborus diversus]|uniref:uncharacterized protein LOC129217026 n=1 Tax=Uloborus diversus TaxID=327109 RepID=UPI0024096364|nr:uncharacterized protein LOC129217026 [Uloborus diversus]